MENDTNKLEHFTETILRDADERSQKILESVEKARKARLDAAEKELKARLERQVEAGIAQVKSKTGQAVSQKMMEDKRRLFEKRAQVARKIYDDLAEKVESWTESGDYTAWLSRQLEKALKALPGQQEKVYLFCRTQDAEYLKGCMEKCQRPWELAVSESIHMGGLRLECPESHMAVDCTLDSAAQETREHIAEYLGLRLE